MDTVLAPMGVEVRSADEISYPAALEWMRIEEVIRIAQNRGGDGLSRKAFHNRWRSKDEFVRDAVMHAMLYRDDPVSSPARQVFKLSGIASATSVSTAILQLSDELLDALLSQPRSFLLAHIGPLLDQHEDLRAAVVRDMLASRAPWYEGYGDLLTGFGVQLRPGWTVQRVGLALQAMLDGFLLRSRVQREEMEACRWRDASLFADTVVAFTLGIVDSELTQRSTRDAIDDLTLKFRA